MFTSSRSPIFLFVKTGNLKRLGSFSYGHVFSLQFLLCSVLSVSPSNLDKVGAALFSLL